MPAAATAPTTEPQGMLTVDQMVAELYRTVCVSRSGQPCVIDQVNSHGQRLDGHDNWIEKHDAKPETPLGTILVRAFLTSIAGSIGVGFVGVVGWGIVTVMRRALGAP